MTEAHAFWDSGDASGEIRSLILPEPAEGEVRVRTRYSAISRGTETTVFTGHVPPSQYEIMRAPFQEGVFPGPVKYGYLNVGVVDAGPVDLEGRTVFCLYPHQSAYIVPADAVVPIPADVPAHRAVLAGIVETAVNALWDAGPRIGDRVAVIGAGQVGCSVARLLVGIPGVEVTVVDVDPAREATAAALGLDFSLPSEAAGNCDLVFHASSTSAGLQTALDLVGFEGEIVDLSWYGDRPVTVSLGEAFHSGRITLRSSQVGAVAAVRRARRSHRARMELALELLADPVFDALITGRSPFHQLPTTMARIASGELPGLGHLIDYDQGEPLCSQ